VLPEEYQPAEHPQPANVSKKIITSLKYLAAFLQVATNLHGSNLPKHC
jgi:hypothetical protein